MRPRTRAALTALMALGLVLLAPTRALAVAFSISGTVSTVVDDGRLVHPITSGDAFTGWFAYDATGIPPTETLPGYSVREGELGSVVIFLNGLTYMWKPDAISQLQIQNDSIFGGIDQLLFVSDDVADDSELGAERGLHIRLTDPTGTAFDDFDAPSVLDLADFETAEVDWRIREQVDGPGTTWTIPVQVVMTIDSITLLAETPELPPTPLYPDAFDPPDDPDPPPPDPDPDPPPVPEPAASWLLLAAAVFGGRCLRR